VPHVSLVGY